MTRPRKAPHTHPIEVRMEIARRYELGRQNRTKVLRAEFSISHWSLAKMVAEYRAARRKAARAGADMAMESAV